MNLSERDFLYIQYILDQLNIIDEFLTPDPSIFLTSRLHQQAVLHALQTLCETTQRLSVNVTSALLEIPWRDIADFRNVLVHEYLGLDLHNVFDVICVQLPKLKEALFKLDS